MQGADQVNEELEVGFDERFEKSWRYAELVGRLVMVAVAAIGLAGLLGRGPYSHETVTTAGAGLSVDFEPIARSQTGTQVTFHLKNTGSTPTLHLFIGSTTLEPMGMLRILPEPLATNAVDGGLALTVAVPPGTEDADLRLMLMPTGVGPVAMTAQLGGNPPLRWTQTVVP